MADRVMIGWSGNREAELEKTVPITGPAGAEPRVVMSLGPSAEADLGLPDLQPGDRLEIGGELEVTSDASDVGRVGVPYDFAPKVKLRLLLAGSPRTLAPRRGEAVAVGDPDKRGRDDMLDVLEGGRLVVTRFAAALRG